MQENRPITVQAPGVCRRLCAMAYESLLLFGVLMAAALPFGVLTQTRHALDNRHELQLVLFLVLGAYFSWFWTKGQTLAMKTWHLHLERTDGSKPALPIAVLRYVLSWVWVLPSLCIAWMLNLTSWSLAIAVLGWILVWIGLGRMREDRQCWHDVLCGTRVVHVEPAKTAKAPPASIQP